MLSSSAASPRLTASRYSLRPARTSAMFDSVSTS